MLALLGLAGIARRNAFFLGAGRTTATIDLAMARMFQPIFVFIKHTGVIVVSY